MSTHKHIDRICVAVTVFALLITVLFMNGSALGIEASSQSLGYESTLFDVSKVHTIDIVIDDWDAFLKTATSEEYSICSVVIDNEAVKNVAIRGKGNTSLSTVATMGSERYSFKLEFDHYEDGKTYKGLDKLCLNNLIQDNTYMKDYLAYRLMAAYGVDTPLCSFAWITVNGEDWGLYLAVEAVEDSFMERVYNGEGDLYKPDSLSMGGGGPGNGRDFNIDDFINENGEAMGFPGSRGSENGESAETPPSQRQENEGGFPQMPGQGDGNGFPQMPGQGDGNGFPQMPGQGDGSGFPQMPSGDGSSFPGMPEGMEIPEGMEMPEGGFGGSGKTPGEGFGGMPGGMGLGSSDVKLQYSDDDPDSYANIFDNAKSAVTAGDKARLIRSLKTLSEGEDLESVLDVDELLRYFVVHNYLVNSDSYTGAMVHNYYLHESDGKLSMIPWDYNLAFGTFQGSDADAAVNDPIDAPLSVSGDGSRPLVDWIWQSEEYTELYHQYFADFLDTVDISALIDEAYTLIAPYVEKDPTAFCSYEEFETGVATLRSFCEKRTESVRGQLDGTIPSTDEGQQADASARIDASDLALSDMGSMGGGENGGFGGGSFGAGKQPGGDRSSSQSFPTPDSGASGDGGSGTPPSFPQGGSQGSGSGAFPAPGSGGDSMPDFGSAPQGGSGGDFSPSGAGSTDLPFSAQTRNSGVSWLTILVSLGVLAVGLLVVLRYNKRS